MDEQKPQQIPLAPQLGVAYPNPEPGQPPIVTYDDGWSPAEVIAIAEKLGGEVIARMVSPWGQVDPASLEQFRQPDAEQETSPMDEALAKLLDEEGGGTAS